MTTAERWDIAEKCGLTPKPCEVCKRPSRLDPWLPNIMLEGHALCDQCWPVACGNCWQSRNVEQRFLVWWRRRCPRCGWHGSWRRW